MGKHWQEIQTKQVIQNVFPSCTNWTLGEHYAFARTDSEVVGAERQTHINAVEVDTPVGSGPGGNEAIAVLAGRGQGGAGGCQRSRRSHSFLHEGKREDGIFWLEAKQKQLLDTDLKS